MTSMTHTTPDLPAPAGATAGEWSPNLDGVDCRLLEWSRHDTDKVSVAVNGLQEADGELIRYVAINLGHDDLNAADARALATKLIEAADAMDAL